MSDSDPTLPDTPAGSVPPPSPSPPANPTLAGDPELPGDPTQLIDPVGAGMDPTQLIDSAGAGMDPTRPGQPPLFIDPLEAGMGEPTTLIPVTAAVAGMPPIDPPIVLVDPDEFPEEPVPWYKQPGPIAALIVALLLIAGLIAWLVFGGDDDSDEASATSTFLVFETTDDTARNVDVGFLVTVAGPADAPTSFVWLRPDGVLPGETAGERTGSDGRVAFEWEADATVSDPAAWRSTVTALAQVPPGWTPPGPNVECVLRPFDGQVTSVSMNIEVDSNDDTIDRSATVTFPNHTFAAGDSVTCALVAAAPAPTTVVDTTVVETTVVETTVVETTEATTTLPATTLPTTTVAPTTLAPTTVPPTTVPPSTTTTTIAIPVKPSDSLWDIIEREVELSEFEQFVIDAGFRDELDDPKRTFTIFAPTNDAIAAANQLPADSLPTDPDALNDLLLAHASNIVPAPKLADLLKMTSINVLFGGPQPIAAAPRPALGKIGESRIVFQADPASNGVLYMIDKVLTPRP